MESVELEAAVELVKKIQRPPPNAPLTYFDPRARFIVFGAGKKKSYQ